MKRVFHNHGKQPCLRVNDQIHIYKFRGASSGPVRKTVIHLTSSVTKISTANWYMNQHNYSYVLIIHYSGIQGSWFEPFFQSEAVFWQYRLIYVSYDSNFFSSVKI